MGVGVTAEVSSTVLFPRMSEEDGTCIFVLRSYAVGHNHFRKPPIQSVPGSF